ncbi:hypothetical protein RB653_001691 [Dictyostelium firmibasis]|uniref:Uncharacterized protein n=1 Tax=Dictyostelium firmibasis TaxID=79012 RepID=A0AAN7TXF2_9MYCE
MTLVSDEKQPLAPIIFPYVAPYLIYKLKFLNILELSLLSKQCFKVIRNLITNNSKELKIVLGDYQQLKEYIQLSFIYSLSYSNYEFKLIQYKDIEYISLFKNFSGQYYYSHVINVDENNDCKEYLLSYCPKLKNIHWKVGVLFLKFTENLIDYTDNGLFSFDCLTIIIDIKSLPYSDSNEKISLQYINTHTLQTENVFTFKFIENYNPRKLIINDDNVNLFYDNIFKLPTLKLEKLEFKRYIVGSSSLLEYCLKCLNDNNINNQPINISNLKSLHFDIICQLNDDNDQNYNTSLTKEIQSIKQIILKQINNKRNNNKTSNLKKLKITFNFTFLKEHNNNNQYLNELITFKNFIDSINHYDYLIVIIIKIK